MSSELQQATPPLAVIIPCLNEEESIGECIREALAGIAKAGIPGEVVCADNGSVDNSNRIAAAAGARVVVVPKKGYGSAIMGGIAETSAQWIVMADADGSYDLMQIPRFVEQLRRGADLVQGCRFPTGGGAIERGAMPRLHRYIGNPVLSWLVRRWFASPVRDVHCGMRAFSREAILRLDLRCAGMEFASEMVIKAALHGLSTAQVPITLRRDRRVEGARHLRTFRDGWRHLRFMLLLSPRWLFMVPGLCLVIAGLVGYALALPRITIGGVRFDVGTLLVASLAIVAGLQSILFGLFAKTFATLSGLRPSLDRQGVIGGERRLESQLIGAVALAIAGALLIASAIRMWVAADYGDLDYRVSMRWLIPGSMLVTLALQAGLGSFFLSMLQLPVRK